MYYIILDITFAVEMLNRYTSNLNSIHSSALNSVIKHLKETMNYVLWYDKYCVVVEGRNDITWNLNLN